MHLDTAALLACPNCQGSYEIKSRSASTEHIHSGLLHCPQCLISVPVVEGFALFNEARPASIEANDTEVDSWLADLIRLVTATSQQYTDFLEQKSQRQTADAYAAFQPFNESTRALYPLLPVLREVLQAGDVILDTWCRTGWSGELLAGLFPEQRVISIWESNSNVLGYRGFSHWLAESRRAPNLDIVFAHPDKGLPIHSQAVRVVHGLDSLHRYSQQGFAQDCLRVCREDGVLVFPHIHLSNAQPEPFFERGCHQYYGHEWKARLQRCLANSRRRAWVFAELDLFEADAPITIADQSDTEHYNGLVLIAAPEFQDKALEPCSILPIKPDSYLLLNPLIGFDYQQGKAECDVNKFSGLVQQMLQRHPAYAARLRQRMDKSEAISANMQARLDGDEVRLLWQATQAKTVAQIASAMQLNIQRVIELAQGLAERELIHPAPVSKAMTHLQNYYADLHLPEQRFDNFSDLWQSVTHLWTGQPVLRWLADGSALGMDDVSLLVSAIRRRLIDEGVMEGKRVLIVCDHHPEALLLCWAAWLNGAVTAMVDASLSDMELGDVARSTAAHMIFASRPVNQSVGQIETVVFDAEGIADSHSFSSWLGDLDGLDGLEEPSLDDKIPPLSAQADAAILYTSGSRGKPKGIVLSQQALCFSAHNMVASYAWQQEVVLSLGPLSMMSGLRNSALAALLSLSTVVIPDTSPLPLPLRDWSHAEETGVTVITTVPAWLNGLMQFSSNLRPLPDVRQILLTGSFSDVQIGKKAAQDLGVFVGDYYGLTETAGICAAVTTPQEYGSLGKAVQAVLQIVDADGLPVTAGKSGMLRIYSDQLMTGYLDDPEASARIFKQGWLYSGDLAHWDDAQNLVIEGRDDDWLKRRDGRRFHSHQLELKLLEYPDIIDVAVWMEDRQQRLVALVVRASEASRSSAQVSYSSSKAEIIAGLPGAMRPDIILEVESLPRGSNGKMDQARLEAVVRSMV